MEHTIVAVRDVLSLGYGVGVRQFRPFVSRNPMTFYPYDFTMILKGDDTVHMKIRLDDGYRLRQVSLDYVVQMLRDDSAYEVYVMYRGEFMFILYKEHYSYDQDLIRSEFDEFLSVQRRLSSDNIALDVASNIWKEAEYAEFINVQRLLAGFRVPKRIAATMWTNVQMIDLVERFCIRRANIRVHESRLHITMPDFPECDSLQSTCLKALVCSGMVDSNFVELTRVCPEYRRWEQYAVFYQGLFISGDAPFMLHV